MFDKHIPLCYFVITMNDEITTYIRQVRSLTGLNQTEFARLVLPDKNPKIAQSYISKYESGTYRLPAEIFIRYQRLHSKYAKKA